MTTASQEQLRPSPPYRYAELSQEHIAEAEEFLEAGNALQAAEAVWGAAASTLKAVCQERGWNHRYHNHLRAAALYLAEEGSRPDFIIAFAAFDSLHTNNYEHQWYAADVVPLLDLARDFCQALDQLRQTPPPDWNRFSRQKRQSLTHRLRELTRPLPARAAFGPELSGSALENLPPVQPPHTREVDC